MTMDYMSKAFGTPGASCQRDGIMEPEWRRGLLLTEKGAPRKDLANVLHVLGKHPDWDGVLAYNEFSERIVTLRTPPTREQDAPAAPTAGEWTDADAVRTSAWFASAAGFAPSVQSVASAVIAAAERHLVHPVRDWLDGLAWDRVPRLDRFLSVYLGAEATPYTAAVGSRWMISGVARVYKPGCKADHVLVLEGPQGIGKSSALRTLAGDGWFCDTGIEIGHKDSYQVLHGVWIYELSELASLRGREAERIKAFLSSTSDRYRPSYARLARDFPRQTIFAGSTNEATYLADPTGARRFWPARCGRINLHALRRDRPQLWAEAVVRYRAGESWHLDAPSLVSMAVSVQDERTEHDDWIEIVEAWLQRLPEHAEAGVTTADVLTHALGFSADKIQMRDTQRAGRVLRALKYAPRQVRRSGARDRRYYPTQSRPDPAAPATQPVPEHPHESPSGHKSQVSQAAGRNGGAEGEGSAWSTEAEQPALPVTCDAYERAERLAIEEESTS